MASHFLCFMYNSVMIFRILHHLGYCAIVSHSVAVLVGVHRVVCVRVTAVFCPALNLQLSDLMVFSSLVLR